MQILIIHGGEAFETYEEYIEHLKTKELTMEKLRSRGWKKNLEQVLGPDFDVLTPRMPNSQNARYAEWKIWFEKIIPLLDEEVVLLGHSLGAIFLAKYLSENTYLKKIRATLLVAAPFNTPEIHPLVDFNLGDDLDGLAKQGGKILLYHSRDDKVVRYKNCEMYKAKLPQAEVRTFEDRGHFNLEKFPEIAEDIRAL